MWEHPKIFEYTNYRKFLRDLCVSKRKSREKLSLRQLSRAAGFKSPSFVALVIDGKRNLSQESIRRLAGALELNKSESEFFTNLVLLNQAESIEDRRYHAEQILKSRSYKKQNPLRPAQFDYYSKWFYVAVRELAGTREFREDPEWIAKQMMPPISASEAKTALEALIALGLLKRESGKLVVAEQSLATADEVGLASVAQFHREMIKKGSESIERFPAVQREISAITFGVDEACAKELKKAIQKFREELTAIILNSKESTRIFQLNFQMFPLSAPQEKKKKEE